MGRKLLKRIYRFEVWYQMHGAEKSVLQDYCKYMLIKQIEKSITVADEIQHDTHGHRHEGPIYAELDIEKLSKDYDDIGPSKGAGRTHRYP